jgi:hypothetical protein
LLLVGVFQFFFDKMEKLFYAFGFFCPEADKKTVLIHGGWVFISCHEGQSVFCLLRRMTEPLMDRGIVANFRVEVVWRCVSLSWYSKRIDARCFPEERSTIVYTIQHRCQPNLKFFACTFSEKLKFKNSCKTTL